jgi:hypothetical protein
MGTSSPVSGTPVIGFSEPADPLLLPVLHARWCSSPVPHRDFRLFCMLILLPHQCSRAH